LGPIRIFGCTSSGARRRTLLLLATTAGLGFIRDASQTRFFRPPLLLLLALFSWAYDDAVAAQVAE
jgi:hypothetical protein